MWLYNIAIVLYSLAIKLGSLWIPKAKLWCEGRENIFERMASAIAPEDRVMWIHVASLGEFEQGRPIMERFKAEHPDYKILLTFYSPSGYTLRKDYSGADYIFYLPIDTKANAKRFLDIAHPEMAIFVKYEFWLNMLLTLKQRNIKTYIVSAIFRSKSIFFRWSGTLWRRALKAFTILFVQNEESKQRLGEIGFSNVVVAGDTRFDRVAHIAENVKRNDLVEKFKGDTPLFVAGSSWPADEELLFELIKENEGIKFVIAPHEIEDNRVEELRAKLSSVVRYTQADLSTVADKQILILDTMGQLSSIYHYASWAYIGGGFGVGIHNTLEASTFGLPMAFGTNYHKFKEAEDMVELGVCRSVANAGELKDWFSHLSIGSDLHRECSDKMKKYTLSHIGASKRILDTIFVQK